MTPLTQADVQRLRSMFERASPGYLWGAVVGHSVDKFPRTDELLALCDLAERGLTQARVTDAPTGREFIGRYGQPAYRDEAADRIAKKEAALVPGGEAVK